MALANKQTMFRQALHVQVEAQSACDYLMNIKSLSDPVGTEVY
jgi:hypothetical protein